MAIRNEYVCKECGGSGLMEFQFKFCPSCSGSGNVGEWFEYPEDVWVVVGVSAGLVLVFAVIICLIGGI